MTITGIKTDVEGKQMKKNDGYLYRAGCKKRDLIQENLECQGDEHTANVREKFAQWAAI